MTINFMQVVCEKHEYTEIVYTTFPPKEVKTWRQCKLCGRMLPESTKVNTTSKDKPEDKADQKNNT